MADNDLSHIDLDNPEFQDAWSVITRTNRSVFLTGKAGTGKSTFLKYICANTKKKHIVLAPTGIAAVNVRRPDDALLLQNPVQAAVAR